MKHQSKNSKSTPIRFARLKLGLKLFLVGVVTIGSLSGLFTFYHFFLRPTGVVANKVELTRGTLLDVILGKFVEDNNKKQDAPPTPAPTVTPAPVPTK